MASWAQYLRHTEHPGGPTTTTTRTPRTRWAGIGAALAVAAGAGGLGIANAASSVPATYQAINPCRLIGTRADAAFHIGPHATLGPAVSIVVDGWGAQGQCALPTDTTGLQLNVTAVGASDPTYLTLFPGDGTPPNASHLNPAPGQPPTPNAVTLQLDDAGRFSIFNRFGSVDVIVDVVGTYSPAGDGGAGPHEHDERYYTEDEVDAWMTDVDDRLSREADAEQTMTIPANALRPVTSTLPYLGSPYDGAYSNVGNAILDAPVLLPVGP